jgi:peptidoglycan/xylan/chitin deacetylase (PgdA/CDA1 family)
LTTLAVAQSGGVFSRVANSKWRQRRLMVLCYHGIAARDEHEWSTLYVSQAHLRRRLERLRALDCTILPLEEALERQKVGDLPPRAVAITFDDGASDFETRAYPVLQEFSAPVMLYQTTWYVDKPFPVFNTGASYLMWKARGRDVRLPWRQGTERIPATTLSPGFQALHGDLRAHVAREQLNADQQNELLRAIAEACGERLECLFEGRLLHLMTSEQLRGLDPTLVDVQLHTHRHRAPKDRTLFVRELSDNGAALQRILARPLALRHFCYPSGYYEPTMLGWLRELDIASAATCDPGIVQPDGDPLLLPRLVDTMHLTDTAFDAWVLGAAAMLPQRIASRG